jgi:hypothetical protein
LGAGARIPEEFDQPGLDLVRHDVFPAAGLFVHEMPRQPDDVNEQPLSEPMLAKNALRDRPTFLRQRDVPSTPTDISVRAETIQHFGDRGSGLAQTFGDPRLEDRRSLLDQGLYRLEVLLNGRMVLDRLRVLGV